MNEKGRLRAGLFKLLLYLYDDFSNAKIAAPSDPTI